LNGGKLPFHILSDAAGRGNDTVQWEPAHLIWLAGVTAAFSFACVAYIRLDENRLFRFLRLSERTTRNSIWNDILESEAINGQPIQVELADARSVIGSLLYYSDVAEDASVYLTEASWVDAEGITIPIPGLGILLTKASGIRSLSLLYPVSEDAVDSAETETTTYLTQTPNPTSDSSR